MPVINIKCKMTPVRNTPLKDAYMEDCSCPTGGHVTNVLRVISLKNIFLENNLKIRNNTLFACVLDFMISSLTLLIKLIYSYYYQKFVSYQSNFLVLS